MTVAFTEAQVARIIVHPLGIFPPRLHVAVENVSWGLLDWEADIVLMNRNGFATEVEIKVSWADLVRDRHKSKHAQRLLPPTNPARQVRMRRFFYAMPDAVWKRLQQEPRTIPADAGVIVISSEYVGKTLSDAGIRHTAAITKKAKTNTNAPALTLQQRFELARLGTLRYWDGRTRA